MPFDGDDGDDPPRRPKKGVKLNNKNSSIPSPKSNGRAMFESRADEAFSKYEEYKQRTWDLSTKFKSFVGDRVLLENKSVITKGLENEVLDKLVALASEMNANEYQPEGIGSVALNMLLMKCMLLQRDIINTLSYKIEKIEKQIVMHKSNDDTAGSKSDK
jgi:hypothetical protein